MSRILEGKAKLVRHHEDSGTTYFVVEKEKFSISSERAQIEKDSEIVMEVEDYVTGETYLDTKGQTRKAGYDQEGNKYEGVGSSIKAILTIDVD